MRARRRGSPSEPPYLSKQLCRMVNRKNIDVVCSEQQIDYAVVSHQYLPNLFITKFWEDSSRSREGFKLLCRLEDSDGE